jgi:hypothetical protein
MITLRVTIVSIGDGNSTILIILYGLLVMSLWGSEGWWEQLGFGCGDAARQEIDRRTEHCCRDQHPPCPLPPHTPASLTTLSVLCEVVSRYSTQITFCFMSSLLSTCKVNTKREAMSVSVSSLRLFHWLGEIWCQKYTLNFGKWMYLRSVYVHCNPYCTGS